MNVDLPMLDVEVPLRDSSHWETKALPVPEVRRLVEAQM